MNPLLQQLQDQVTKTTGILDSATTFINGVPALIQKAKDDAIANGATEAQLQPVEDLAKAMSDKADALAAAVAANSTP